MKPNGFTLTEVAIVTAIVGLCSAVAVPIAGNLAERTNTNICAMNRNSLASAEGLFVAAEGRHSSSMQELFDLAYLKSTSDCPAGYEYVWNGYEPICPEHTPDLYSISIYGSIVVATRSIELYDSGALLSRVSELSYVPDYDQDTIYAMLGSGTEVQTNDSGGATITLDDGSIYNIDDVFNSWQYLRNDIEYGDDGVSYSADYMWVGYGYAYEGSYDNNYLNYEYTYDEATGSYFYDAVSTYSSAYSGASLSTDYGYVYEGSYSTNEPSRSSYSYDVQEDGSYSGQSSYYNNVSNEYNYGYNQQGTENQFMYTVDSTYNSSYDVDYSYDASSQIYTSTSSGSYAYNYDYDLGNDQTEVYDDAYTYDGNHTHNRSTGAYSSTYNYNYESGSNFTYNYSYNPATRTYTYTYTNNVNGETTTRTYTIG